MTGYTATELRGRKCGFLQGKDPNYVNDFRAVISTHSEGFVKIMNQRSNGSSFLNMLYL